MAGRKTPSLFAAALLAASGLAVTLVGIEADAVAVSESTAKALCQTFNVQTFTSVSFGFPPTVFPQDTLIRADSVTIAGPVTTTDGRQGTPLGPRGRDLCLWAETIEIDSGGVLCSGSGADGTSQFGGPPQPINLPGRGGNIFIILQDSPATTTTPSVTVRDGGVLCTGDGGGGGGSGSVECPAGETANADGQDGADAGMLQFFSSGTTPSISSGSLLLGTGGNGGLALALAGPGGASAMGGAGGNSLAYLNAELLDAGKASWLGFSGGGEGGQGMAIPCFTPKCEDMAPWPACLFYCDDDGISCQIKDACAPENGGLLNEECRALGLPGEPDEEKCTASSLLASLLLTSTPSPIEAKGGDGGYGFVKGGDGGLAQATGCDNPGKGVDGEDGETVCNQSPCATPTHGDPGEKGGDGPPGGEASATGGNGGGSLLEGGAGGSAVAKGGLGGRGGKGGNGADAINCGDGGRGGDGGKGGPGGPASATGGDGGNGTAPNQGVGGTGGSAHAASKVGSAGGPGGSGGKADHFYDGLAALPCFPWYRPSDGESGNVGAPGVAGSTQQTGGQNGHSG